MSKIYSTNHKFYNEIFDSCEVYTEYDKYLSGLENLDKSNKKGLFSKLYRKFYYKSYAIRLIKKLLLCDYLIVYPDRMGYFILGLWIGMGKAVPIYLVNPKDNTMEPISNFDSTTDIINKKGKLINIKYSSYDESNLDKFIEDVESNEYKKCNNKFIYYKSTESSIPYIILGILFARLDKNRKFIRLLHESKELDSDFYKKISSFMKPAI